MKTFCCGLILFCFISTTKAQNEYFQHNPEWTVMEMWSQTYPCIAYDTVTFYLNGDTVINSLTYKQVYTRGTCRNTWWSSNPNMSCSLTPYNYPYSGYMGAVRSAGTEVFYVSAQNSGETRLYDFNLQVGSHLPYCPQTTPDTMITVAYIDSVYTPYGYLKKFHFSTDTMQFVMEGAMSSYGFYHYCGPMMDFGSYSMCYTLNDTAWWPQQGPNCDALLLSTSEPETPVASLNLFPNPARDVVEIQLTGVQLQSVAVYNVFGACVKEQKAEAKLFIGDLSPGIYFVKVNEGEHELVRRLIVN